MNLPIIPRAFDEEQVAAVIAVAIEYYLGSPIKQATTRVEATNRWAMAGRLESQGFQPTRGLRRAQWGRDVH